MPALAVKFPVPVYVGVPPVALIEMVAVPPLQGIGLTIVAVGVSCEGWMMLAVVLAEHPLASVTV